MKTRNTNREKHRKDTEKQKKINQKKIIHLPQSKFTFWLKTFQLENDPNKCPNDRVADIKDLNLQIRKWHL